jgi:hypothetical protein
MILKINKCYVIKFNVLQEATEKLQSMRFQLQLSRVEDQKTPILNLQESVR